MPRLQQQCNHLRLLLLSFAYCSWHGCSHLWVYNKCCYCCCCFSYNYSLLDNGRINDGMFVTLMQETMFFKWFTYIVTCMPACGGSHLCVCVCVNWYFMYHHFRLMIPKAFQMQRCCCCIPWRKSILLWRSFLFLFLWYSVLFSNHFSICASSYLIKIGLCFIHMFVCICACLKCHCCCCCLRKFLIKLYASMIWHSRPCHPNLFT